MVVPREAGSLVCSSLRSNFEWGRGALLNKLLMVAACLLLPILWGVVVNWMFNFWSSRSARNESDDEPIFPDYQI